jgi:hypothetical protein
MATPMASQQKSPDCIRSDASKRRRKAWCTRLWIAYAMLILGLWIVACFWSFRLTVVLRQGVLVAGLEQDDALVFTLADGKLGCFRATLFDQLASRVEIEVSRIRYAPFRERFVRSMAWPKYVDTFVWGDRLRGVSLPLLWFLIVVPVAWYRTRRTAALSFSCLGCGYDLRGSQYRCPECGRAKDHSLAREYATSVRPSDLDVDRR